MRHKLGLTGENLYDITEEAVVKKWEHFSDGFRHDYRGEIYEE